MRRLLSSLAATGLGGGGVSIQRFLPATHPDAWFPESFRRQPCYYCYSPLTSPFVVWMGAGEPIALHPACVVELSIRLFRDVHEIECETDYVTRRDPLAELRERLQREEWRR